MKKPSYFFNGPNNICPQDFEKKWLIGRTASGSEVRREGVFGRNGIRLPARNCKRPTTIGPAMARTKSQLLFNMMNFCKSFCRARQALNNWTFPATFRLVKPRLSRHKLHFADECSESFEEPLVVMNTVCVNIGLDTVMKAFDQDLATYWQSA